MSARYVYFIRPVGEQGPVKIGSTETLVKRLSRLLVWSPYVLEIAATIPGDRDLEANIQDCFYDLHIHREWFLAAPRLTFAIERLRAGEPIASVIDLGNRLGSVKRRIALQRWEARRK